MLSHLCLGIRAQVTMYGFVRLAATRTGPLLQCPLYTGPKAPVNNFETVSAAQMYSWLQPHCITSLYSMNPFVLDAIDLRKTLTALRNNSPLDRFQNSLESSNVQVLALV